VPASDRETTVVSLASRLILPVLLACSALGAGCGGEHGAIRVGLVGPFGQPRGRSMRLAAELAAREINGAGGVRGRSLELVILDDQADAVRAVNVARQLYDDPTVVAVIGHLTSGATLAAGAIYNAGLHPVPMISPSASSPLLSGAGPYTFRICPTDLAHGTRLAQWAVDQLHARRAAILFLNDEYGRGVRGVFAQQFTARGGRLVADDPYLDELPSFEPFLERIRRRGGTDVLLVAGTRPGAERILQTLGTMGLRPAVLAGDGVAGIEAAGRLAEGVYVSAAYLPDQPGEANAAFVRAYQAAYDGQQPDHRGAGTYDIVHLLARAIEAVGPDRAKLRDYLAGFGSETEAYDGVTGRIAFDAKGDVPGKEVVIGVVRGGRLVSAEARP
jgi:branched-chain amino acid transport system substrate-binding protein